jgi:hypothetical protein
MSRGLREFSVTRRVFSNTSITKGLSARTIKDVFFTHSYLDRERIRRGLTAKAFAIGRRCIFCPLGDRMRRRLRDERLSALNAFALECAPGIRAWLANPQALSSRLRQAPPLLRRRLQQGKVRRPAIHRSAAPMSRSVSEMRARRIKRPRSPARNRPHFR